MLNKVKLIGKVLPLEIKEKEEEKELIVYFSLMVPNPSESVTILRCVAQGETAEKLKEELQENDIAEIRGYLRNERSKPRDAFQENFEVSQLSDSKDKKINRQILTKVVEFTKLDINFKDIDKETSNQVQLIGKIITDFKNLKENNPELLAFKIAVPRGKDSFPLFFCRVQGELIAEFNQLLNRGDIILLEGFLQTKKNVKEGGDIERISSIICQGFTFLDNNLVKNLSPLGELTRIFKDVKKIDFTKPKKGGRIEE